MLLAAGFMVATTLPANAFLSTGVSASSAVYEETVSQELSVLSEAEAPTAERVDYTVADVEQWIATASGFSASAVTDSVVWPVGADAPLTSDFGPRPAPCSTCSSNHKGLDLARPNGYPIVASADGVVRQVQVSNSGYGNFVLIDHVVDGQVVQTAYAHMTYGSITVEEGQFVSAGQQIGAVGNTGDSTGNHLHFELRKNAVQVDPLPWLREKAAE